MRTDLAGYMPIVMASRKCNCQVRELVEMVLNGQLSGLGRADGEMVFANFYIDWKEAHEKRKFLAMADISSNLLTIEQTARALGTTKGNVYPLVASKLLLSISKFNPTRCRDQLFVAPGSLDEFKRLYMSIAGIANHCGTRADIIANRMELLVIDPVFDPGGRSGRFYRKSDLAEFILAKSASREKL